METGKSLPQELVSKLGEDSERLYGAWAAESPMMRSQAIAEAERRGFMAGFDCGIYVYRKHTETGDV